MRVLFLTRYDERGASSRCRVYQYLPYLAARGIAGDVVPVIPPAVDLWQRAGAADVVFLQKRVPTLAKLILLRRRAPVIVFDFDDAIWLRRRRDNTVCAASPRTRLRLAAALRLSDQVIAGNEYLAAYARRWNPRVAVLPTPVDADYYSRGQRSGACPASGNPPERKGGQGGRGEFGDRPLTPDPCPLSPVLRIGWVGHSSNLCYLRRLEPALAALARRYPGLLLRVICSEPFQTPAVPVENVPWSLADEVTNLRSLDIGLMPLDDDAWTRGKCGFKALQYMAVGIPVVCSPVGMNVDIVRDGETGLLAGDLISWERQLYRLVESAALRQQLGAAGQQAVLQQYSLATMAPRLADLLRPAIRGGTDYH